MRGGDCGSYAFNQRCAVRLGNLPATAGSTTGFRCVRGL
jgi:formylglycine-generating enzyme required for sulfatase activity